MIDPQTIAAVLRLRAESQPERLAYGFVGGHEELAQITYGELYRRVCAVALNLRSDGVSIGDRIVLVGSTSVDFVAGLLGALYAGCVVAPLSPPRSLKLVSQVERILSNLRPHAVLADEEAYSRLKSTAPGSEGSVRYFTMSAALRADKRSGTVDAECKPADTAVIQYTSGSTSAPKGVEISHANLLHNASIIANIGQLTDSSVGVSWLPLYHDMGLMTGVILPLVIGFPCVLMTPTTFLSQPATWLRTISRCRGTISGAPNFAYSLCAEKVTDADKIDLDLSCWDVAYCGSELVRADTRERFIAQFAKCGFDRRSFYPCYGLAEATLMVSGGPKNEVATVVEADRDALERLSVVRDADEGRAVKRIMSSGRPVTAMTVIIVDSGRRERCVENQIGEVWIRGGSVSRGYWNLTGETSGAFDGRLLPSNDGPFLRTGDVGFMRDGHLFVLGRIKDMIIVRGHNHYPQDLELTAQSSHPALQAGRGVAFSVEQGDQECPIIVHEIARHWRGEMQIIVDAMRQSIATHHGVDLAAAVLVRQGMVPKTTSGKIQRSAVKTAFLNDTLNIVFAWYKHDFQDFRARSTSSQGSSQTKTGAMIGPHLAAILQMPLEQIARDRSLESYGIDRLQLGELIGAVGTDTGIYLDMSQLLGAQTIAELDTLLSQSMRNARQIELQSKQEESEDSLRHARQRGQRRGEALMRARARNIAPDE